ncbi:MAG: winged helix-turn-helix domain-containing protein [Candidatus Diapherotrites archaeon]
MPPPPSAARFRIVIRRIERPFRGNTEQELEWICQSLGLTSIGKDKVTADIFREIVRSTEEGKGISSTLLAQRIHLSRGAVIHHLNNLQAAGLVVKQGREYVARSKSMVRTIQEVEEDIKRIFDKMEETAREIDRAFGMDWESPPER